MKKLAIISAFIILCVTAFAQNKTLQPVIAEVIMPGNSSLDFNITNKVHPDTGLQNVMRWKNRIVFYTKTKDVIGFERLIIKNFGKNKVIFFQNPFYNFNRKYCSDKTVAKEWTNIILSANLVNDPKMQQEYLNYHATQFQKWPEVSQGFCNAHFQQLLVFKTGRQLMLVISIPKGKTLDELNPLTSKNNPRVDDWNKMMSKYQEGIEGTKKGETWVFFKDIDKDK